MNVRHQTERVNTPHDPPQNVSSPFPMAVCISTPPALRCLDMYQIYSIQRPGRPRWALAASAFLLLLTVIMAATLVHYKSALHTVELGEEIVFTDARIKVRMPAGWTDDLENTQLPDGAVALFVEPTRPNMLPGRKIVLFRGRPASLGLPANHLRSSIAAWIKTIIPGGRLRLQKSISHRIEYLPSLTDIYLFQIIDQVTGQQVDQHIIGQAVMAPGGQTFGLVLFSLNPSVGTDLHLIDQISNHLRITDVEIAEEPSVLMQNAGIDFPVLAQAVYLKETESNLPRVRIMDGRRETVWFLDIYRIPLPDPQTPERVITNATLGLLEITALPHSPQTLNKEHNREVCQLTIPIPGNTEGLMELWCIRTDPYTGLMLKGRCEKGAEKELKTICQKIADQAVVKSYADLTAVGQRQAGQYLRQIAEWKLSTWWSDRQGETLFYLMGSPGLTFGQQAVQIRAQQREASTWWEMDNQTVLDIGHRVPFQIHETWIVRDDISAYALRSESPRGKYAEFLESGQNELRSELLPPDGPSVKRSIRVQDTFGCEPVLLLAGGLLANDDSGKTAYFTGKEMYSPYLSGWWVTSLGMRPLPVGQQQARAVCVQLDSSPEPVFLYYNEMNELLAVALDDSKWWQRKDLITNERYFEQTVPNPR